MATKKVAKSNAWEQVWVISGDPCLCGFALEAALEEYGKPATVRYDKNDSIKTLKAAFEAFAFTSPADAIILTDPNAEMLKVCLEAVEGGIFRISALIIITPGGSLDGRAAFASRATKQNRVYYFPPIVAPDRMALKKHLSEWSDNEGVLLSRDAMAWILDNAPTKQCQVNNSNGKKDAIVYDLLHMENELSKVAVVALHEGRDISEEDVSTICYFDHASDIWAFVNSVMLSDAAKILQFFDKLVITQTNQGALWLLVSQFEFLIKVKSVLDQGISSQAQIQDKLSLEGMLGHYLGEDLLEPENVPKAPVINPYRIQMAIPNCQKVPIEKLVQQCTATIMAIRDIRSGMMTSLVLPYLALALSGHTLYNEPLYDLKV